jgi:hypothetical protein
VGRLRASPEEGNLSSSSLGQGAFPGLEGDFWRFSGISLSVLFYVR